MHRLLLCSVFLWSTQAFVCTSFLVDRGNNAVVGKSYDWNIGNGLLTVNKRNVEKESLSLFPDDSSIRWVSKYGSVTFNQYGVEFPNGGINEAGLVVEILWLSASEYPGADSRPTINELQWIQYQLDNFSTTSEVISNIEKIRISNVYGNVHYFICDKSRHCAVAEWLKGQTVISDGALAITNNSFADSDKYLANFSGFGGKNTLPLTMSSLDRFARARIMSEYGTASSAQDESWQILNSVSSWKGKGHYGSYWGISYDLDSIKLTYRHSEVGRKQELDLGRLNFSCKLPRLTYDLESDHRGTNIMYQLRSYTKTQNKAHIRQSVSSIPTKLPVGIIQLLASIPESFRCTE